MTIGERPTRWEIAAADRADQLAIARAQNADYTAEIRRLVDRVAHLEELIVTFATADANWFRPISEATTETVARLHAAEVALRDEADQIRTRTATNPKDRPAA